MLINPELIALARFTAGGHWAPAGALEKAAVVPPGGGGDPSGGGGPPPGADPGGGGPPPGGGGPPPGAAPPGADPTGGAGGAPPGGPPPGPLDPAALQQITMAVTQAMGGAGGAGGKKSPKDQIQGSQMKILMHMVAQMASKMGVQVDPQMLVPPSDPSSDQMAMSELQNTPMMPSMSPDAAGGAGGSPPGGPPPGGDPSGGGGDPSGGGGAGPGPVQPMDAAQGPIGKAAGVAPRPSLALALADHEGPIGQEYTIPQLRKNREKAAARLALLRSLSRG